MDGRCGGGSISLELPSNHRVPKMKSLLLNILLVCTSMYSARAKLLPSYRMDSLVLLSDTVVFCEEEDVRFNKIQHGAWTEERTITKCKVIQTFKGDLKTNVEFMVEYDSIFKRYLANQGGYTQVDASGKVLRVVQPEYLPRGRVLLFLKRNPDNGANVVVSAKLVQNGEVFQFGQFQSDPGPLVLGGQGPENINLSKGRKYGEQELLQDLVIALKKADSLKAPVPLNPWDVEKVDPDMKPQ